MMVTEKLYLDVSRKAPEGISRGKTRPSPGMPACASACSRGQVQLSRARANRQRPRIPRPPPPGRRLHQDRESPLPPRNLTRPQGRIARYRCPALTGHASRRPRYGVPRLCRRAAANHVGRRSHEGPSHAPQQRPGQIRDVSEKKARKPGLDGVGGQRASGRCDD